MAIDVSKLQLTSRDYLEIFKDLVDTIPDLTDKWVSNDENDPGIVLVKLMSMVGDMLSYNHDKAVLEVYPNTVTQRQNAYQIFGLTGYKMHWYRSARCTAYLSNMDVRPAILPRYTSFATLDGKIAYTYIGEPNSQWKTIESNARNNGATLEVELIQGSPITPSLVSSYVIPHLENKEWHYAYNYNISKIDIVDGNKIYLWDQNVSEDSITLIGDGTEWIQTDNIDVVDNAERYYEFKVDENNNPYLQLISYWSDYNPSGNFKVFYVISNGEEGVIGANTLYKPISGIVYFNPDTGEQDDLSNMIEMTNDASTIGYNPETCDQARSEYVKYINTHDTLVTLSDFTKATKRLNGVANCYCTDRTNDPNPDDLSVLDLNIYIATTEDYPIETQEDEDLFIESVDYALRDNKMIPLNINVNLHGIHYFNWNVAGKIYTKELITIDRAQDIIVNINNKLKQKYAISNMQFNSTVNYVDVVDDILGIDALIKNVYLEPIVFTDTVPYIDFSGNEQILKVDAETITGNYTLITQCVKNVGKVLKTISIDDTHHMVDSQGNTIDYVYYPMGDTTEKLSVQYSGNFSPNTQDCPRYVLTNDSHSICIYTSSDGKDLSTHGYYKSAQDKFFYDEDYTYEIVPETDALYYDDTDYGSEPQYRLYKYDGSTYVGQSNPWDRIEQIPIKFLTIEHDISTHGYYNSDTGEFYITDAYNPGEIIPKVEGQYYTDDKTDKVYLCNGSVYVEQLNPEVVICTYLLTDDNEDPLDLKTPIRPGKFVVKVDNDRHIVYDNQNKELVSESGIFMEGSIDYKTADFYLEFSTNISNAIFAYTKNNINMVKFQGIDVNQFYIADECLKKT